MLLSYIPYLDNDPYPFENKNLALQASAIAADRGLTLQLFSRYEAAVPAP